MTHPGPRGRLERGEFRCVEAESATSPLEQPLIWAFASVLKCKLKPTTAAELSAFTSSVSDFTANTVNR
jgi:hypothetical protein